jgi:hypothetical protein
VSVKRSVGRVGRTKQSANHAEARNLCNLYAAGRRTTPSTNWKARRIRSAVWNPVPMAICSIPRDVVSSATRATCTRAVFT